MIQVYYHGTGMAPQLVYECQAPIGEVIAAQIEMWLEDGGKGPQLYWLVYEGHIGATIMRDASDANVAHVTYCDGSRRSFRCEYVLDEEGSYVRSEVTEIDQAE